MYLKLAKIGSNATFSQDNYFMFCDDRYDLRIRYIPTNFLEKLKEDKTTMMYFYHQVREELS